MGELLPFSREPRPADTAAESGGALAVRSDEELMALVRGGSKAAFRVLVVRHGAKVVSFCARISGDRAAAREIAQDVWLAVWDARARWEPRTRFASYLYTVAFSRARNHARSRRRRAAVFSAAPLDADLVPTSSADEIERLLERERRNRLFEALRDLPDDLREAVVLRFVEELSYEEMETVLRAKSSTLRSRVHHALARLKARLGKEAP